MDESARHPALRRAELLHYGALGTGIPGLHYDLDAGPDDLIEVTLDRPANVQLLDPTNYDNYRSGRSFRYLGGYVTSPPYSLRPPHNDHWHVVVDLGGAAGSVRAGVRVVTATATGT